jgi:hypothetical protein
MENVQYIWQYLHRRIEKGDIDELQMRLCVVILREYLNKYREVQALGFVDHQLLVLDRFLPVRNLSTGVNMEAIWTLFKPLTPLTRQSFEDLIRLEQLADQFDEFQWDSQVPPSQLLQIRDSFSNAMQLVRGGHAEVDNRPLIHSLEEALTNLRKMQLGSTTEIRPFFRSEFQKICQRFYLQSAAEDIDNAPLRDRYLRVAVFAEKPTKLALNIGCSTPGQARECCVLQYLSSFVGDYESSEDPLGPQFGLDGSMMNKLYVHPQHKCQHLLIREQSSCFRRHTS